MATEVSDNLTRLQVGFKRELIKEVKSFVVDAQMFRKDWEANGPMVPGLDPMEAVDRLRKFQQMFEVGGCEAGAWLLCCLQAKGCMHSSRWQHVPVVKRTPAERPWGLESQGHGVGRPSTQHQGLV